MKNFGWGPIKQTLKALGQNFGWGPKDKKGNQ